MSDHEHGPRIYFVREIRPNRSLSRGAIVVVLAIFAAFNLFTTVFLLIIHAYPVPFFLGLDMVGVTLAFVVLDRRQNSRIEQVRVSSDEVRVVRRPKGKSLTVWSSAPAFTRVAMDETDEDQPRVALTSSGRRFDIGLELGASGRTQLAQELERAILAARSERYS